MNYLKLLETKEKQKKKKTHFVSIHWTKPTGI